MYILKLKKISKKDCIYAKYYFNYPLLDLLAEFLQDFGFPHEAIRKYVNGFFENPLDNCLMGNTSCVEKKDGKFLLSYQYDDEERYLEIPQEALKKTINLYWDARQKCPKEIIITLDESMLNTRVDIVKCDCLIHRDL